MPPQNNSNDVEVGVEEEKLSPIQKFKQTYQSVKDVALPSKTQLATILNTAQIAPKSYTANAKLFITLSFMTLYIKDCIRIHQDFVLFCKLRDNHQLLEESSINELLGSLTEDEKSKLNQCAKTLIKEVNNLSSSGHEEIQQYQQQKNKYDLALRNLRDTVVSFIAERRKRLSEQSEKPETSQDQSEKEIKALQEILNEITYSLEPEETVKHYAKALHDLYPIELLWGKEKTNEKDETVWDEKDETVRDDKDETVRDDKDETVRDDKDEIVREGGIVAYLEAPKPPKNAITPPTSGVAAAEITYFTTLAKRYEAQKHTFESGVSTDTEKEKQESSSTKHPTHEKISSKTKQKILNHSKALVDLIGTLDDEYNLLQQVGLANSSLNEIKLGTVSKVFPHIQKCQEITRQQLERFLEEAKCGQKEVEGTIEKLRDNDKTQISSLIDELTKNNATLLTDKLLKEKILKTVILYKELITLNTSSENITVERINTLFLELPLILRKLNSYQDTFRQERLKPGFFNQLLRALRNALKLIWPLMTQSERAMHDVIRCIQGFTFFKSGTSGNKIHRKALSELNISVDTSGNTP
jgi:hypothetical protein